MEEERKGFLIFFISIITILFFGLLLYYTFFHTKSEENPVVTPSATLVAKGNESDKYTIDLSTETTTSDTIEFENNEITIRDSGTYTLLGTYEGTIIVFAPKGKVVLRLSEATIESQTSSAIFCKEAVRCTIELVEGTKNRLKSQEETKEMAVISSTSPLLFRGTGSLIINGKSNLGMKVKNASLMIENGTYQIFDKQIGIVVENSTMFLKGGNSTIIAKEECLKTTKEIIITGGNYYLESKEKIALYAMEGYLFQGGTLLSLGVEKGLPPKEVSPFKTLEYRLPERAINNYFTLVGTETRPVFSFHPTMKVREVWLSSSELTEEYYALYYSLPEEENFTGFYLGNIDLKEKVEVES